MKENYGNKLYKKKLTLFLLFLLIPLASADILSINAGSGSDIVLIPSTEIEGFLFGYPSVSISPPGGGHTPGGTPITEGLICEANVTKVFLSEHTKGRNLTFTDKEFFEYKIDLVNEIRLGMPDDVLLTILVHNCTLPQAVEVEFPKFPIFLLILIVVLIAGIIGYETKRKQFITVILAKIKKRKETKRSSAP